MSQELDYLSRCLAAGQLSRREFLGHATALGVSATFANSILASAARASMRSVPVKRVYEKPVLTPLGHMAQVTQKAGAYGPVRGGVIMGGLSGAGAADSLDPATSSTVISRSWI
ncbi:twin-arginine translocation signal domain-containing protein [Mesorhizobium sp.]|uniref:twin-arginine translocation signal domain-containing protein n=1 Tax=Mesorhizobium sp. TaxID=1871066 RepID=UPI0012009439|nr:twin-arginine translocation signal domain-containing protein [Mesorhizobium sp.]TIT03718.1 MAG: twin-arginine translocation signal domain-containing protein [Mesorhizobium sp.]